MKRNPSWNRWAALPWAARFATQNHPAGSSLINRHAEFLADRRLDSRNFPLEDFELVLKIRQPFRETVQSRHEFVEFCRKDSVASLKLLLHPAYDGNLLDAKPFVDGAKNGVGLLRQKLFDFILGGRGVFAHCEGFVSVYGSPRFCPAPGKDPTPDCPFQRSPHYIWRSDSANEEEPQPVDEVANQAANERPCGRLTYRDMVL